MLLLKVVVGLLRFLLMKVGLKQIMKQERKLLIEIRRVGFIVLLRKKQVMFINLKLGEHHIQKVRTLLGLTYMT